MNRIRIGNQSAFSARTMLMPFEYAVANGFDAFEWFPDKKGPDEGWESADLEGETRSYIKDKAFEHDIALSVHASLNADLYKKEDHGWIFRDIELANNIGADLVNIHLEVKENIKKFAGAIKPVIRCSSRAGVRLAIENTPMTGPEEFNRLFTFLKKQKSPAASHVGMCLDLGHANLFSGTNNNYLEYIDRLEPHVPIIHIHLHENYGDSDSHLPFFTGPSAKDTSGIMGFVSRLKKRGYKGAIILEQWPEPQLLLNEARDRLMHMFSISR